MKIRHHRGSLGLAMQTVKEIEPTLEAVANFVGAPSEQVALAPYAYDPRIDWNTYLVTVNGQAVAFTDGPIIGINVPTLPPDPEGMNSLRADWAAYALVAFRSKAGSSMEDVLQDLLCDLMHWCDRNSTVFEFALQAARQSYADEIHAPPEPPMAPPTLLQPAVILTAEQFEQKYIQAYESAGDTWTEEDVEASWQAYMRNPAGHFLSKGKT